MIFDVMKSNDKNDHDAADIICQDCKSIIATLHGPSAHRPGVRYKRAAKAREMASQEIDRLSDTSATDEERQSRKRRLVKGPKEFRDIRGNRPEFKSSGPTYPRSHSRRAPAGLIFASGVLLALARRRQKIVLRLSIFSLSW